MELDITWKKKLVFSGVFVHENMLHAIMDRYLNGITCKQWLLMVVADAYDNPPDLSTLAAMLGCSRQNIKKLASELEKNGYACLTSSKTDGRSVCVQITENGKHIIDDSKNLEARVHNALFKEFSDKEISDYFDLSCKLVKGFAHLEECFKEAKLNGEI